MYLTVTKFDHATPAASKVETKVVELRKVRTSSVRCGEPEGAIAFGKKMRRGCRETQPSFGSGGLRGSWHVAAIYTLRTPLTVN